MIGERTIQTIVTQVESLLNDYMIEADGAFHEDKGLSISLKATVKPTQDSALVVETAISFVTGKVRDKSEQAVINEIQQEIPVDGNDDPAAPHTDDRPFDSMQI